MRDEHENPSADGSDGKSGFVPHVVDIPEVDRNTAIEGLSRIWNNLTFEDELDAVAKRFKLNKQAIRREIKRLRDQARAEAQAEVVRRMWLEKRARGGHDDGQGLYGENWLAACLTSAKGTPLQNTHNVLLALSNDPALFDLFVYDEMLYQPLLIHPVPVSGSSKGTLPSQRPVEGFRPRPVVDDDVVSLQVWLQQAGLPTIGKDPVFDAVERRARDRAFHPVRAYLDGLVWDGRPRLGTWLADTCGVDLTAYSQAIGRMTLIAMVARIMEPGCKADYMLILEGPQGIGKSAACKVLGGVWFSDALPDVTGGKDVSVHLRGKWVIEIAEMSAMSRAEAAALKAFMTRTVEQYRPHYGRKETYEPRQVVFIGTTNKTAYLRDETGARRFWPVKVGRIDLKALTRDRDQLFAEAVALYRDGAQWWPDAAFEREHIKPQQEARFEADAWEDDIREHLVGKKQVTLGDVAFHALSITKERFRTTEQRQVARIMERCGWMRDNGGRPGKGNKRWWVPGPEAA